MSNIDRRNLQVIVFSTSLNILAMKMKIPNGGSGSGYYGHETGITSYMDNNSDTEPEVQGIGDGDFSEYLWMENEEEFDKQVLFFLFVNVKFSKILYIYSTIHTFNWNI